MLTSPLCAGVDALLAPSGCRKSVWRNSRSEHRKKGAGDGVMGWGAWLWLALFFVVLLAVILLAWLFRSPWVDSLEVRRWVSVALGVSLGQALWCLVRHLVSRGRAGPSLLDDAVGVGLGVLATMVV